MAVFEDTMSAFGVGEGRVFTEQSTAPAGPLEAGAFAWYCARTKPKHEHIVAAGLKRQLGLEVFHPRLRMERPTKRGVVRVVEPLFPCYVFVRCNIGTSLDSVRYVN